MNEVTTRGPSGWVEFVWTMRNLKHRAKSWTTGLIVKAIVWLVGDTNSIAHAKRELRGQMALGKDDPDRWMADHLLALVAVFSTQGHSGFSASYCTSALERLMRCEPLSPLTGEDDEWFDHGDGMFQNMRCSHVFKQPDRFNGQAYDIYGRVFREPNGACYTGGKSHVPITFPYTPKREYVDVPASE